MTWFSLSQMKGIAYLADNRSVTGLHWAWRKIPSE